MIKDIKLGENNKVSGFVENIRNKKSMCFIVIKDISNKLQLTVEKAKHPEMEELLNQTIEELNKIVNSRSWKMTQPVRKMKRIVKKIV